MKVYQLLNDNGRAWANQFVITFDAYNIDILRSYKSNVVLYDRNENHIALGDDWDYSKTTTRAVCKFLKDATGTAWTKEEIKRAISDEYITIYNRETGKATGWSFATACDGYFEDFFREGEK